MVGLETWENKCCRCETDARVDAHPGKRACHITCGPCSYPGEWAKCTSCEMVTHCMYALSDLKSRSNGFKKGCFFKEQLTGEETLYHTLNFVNAQQQLADSIGADKYLRTLRRTNSESRCFKK